MIYYRTLGSLRAFILGLVKFTDLRPVINIFRVKYLSPNSLKKLKGLQRSKGYYTKQCILLFTIMNHGPQK